MPYKDPPLPLGMLIKKAAKALTGMRILLVDDSKVSLCILEKLLKTVGIESTCAENGHCALKRLEAKRFDWVLMDIQMPGINGYETIRQIRQTLRLTELPIIVLTGNPLEGEGDACLEAGANGLLGKPILPEELFSLLQQVKTAPLADDTINQEA